MQRFVHAFTLCSLVASFMLTSQPASALETFNYDVSGNISQGSATVSFLVPANKMLVAESLSGRIGVATGTMIQLVEMFQSNNGPPSSALFPPVQMIAHNTFIGQQSEDIYVFNSDLRKYYVGIVSVAIQTDGLSSSGQFSDSVSGYLIPALTGDFNANGTVDAADYVAYRSTLGQSGTGLFADGNDNNTIDPGDYAVWRSLFGTPAMAAGSTVNGAAVPEPATWTSVAIAICSLSFCGRQKLRR